MSNFSDIPSQFDDLIKDHPVVFISYSWDSEEHNYGFVNFRMIYEQSMQLILCLTNMIEAAMT